MKTKKNNGKGSEIRDEYHSMSELYFNRLVLFSVLCNQNPDISWKSKKHEDGTMIPDFFIVGISTPEGDYCYHYQLKYWNLFNIKELEKSPHYDGHTSSDIGRLYSLQNKNIQSSKNEKLSSSVNSEILAVAIPSVIVIIEFAYSIYLLSVISKFPLSVINIIPSTSKPRTYLKLDGLVIIIP